MTELPGPRILAVTLARGGSKGVPHKNIHPLMGEPLLAHTIKEVLRSRLVTRYVVSTDDEAIQRVALHYGAEAPFLRPKELASDDAPVLQALQHAVAWAEADEGRVYDYVIELKCTNPLKTVEDIDGVLEKLIQTGADAVIGMVRVIDAHPARVKRFVDDRIVDFSIPEPDVARRDELVPEAYHRDHSICAQRRDVLMVQGKRWGTPNTRPWVIPAERFANIDTEMDFAIAEAMLRYASSRRQDSKQASM